MSVTVETSDGCTFDMDRWKFESISIPPPYGNVRVILEVNSEEFQKLLDDASPTNVETKMNEDEIFELLRMGYRAGLKKMIHSCVHHIANLLYRAQSMQH